MKKESKLSTYIDKLQCGGQYWFTKLEAVERVGMSASAFKMAAFRLKKDNRIAIVGKGLYLIVPLEHRINGTLPPYWYIDYFMKHIQRDYYVCLLTAAAHYGASHQVSSQFHIMVDRPVLLGKTNPTQLVFFTKKNLIKTPLEKIKTPTGYARISSREATALDLVQYCKHAGGLGLISTILFELAEMVDPKLLALAARQGHYEIATIQRIGYLLDFIGHGEKTRDLYPWLQNEWNNLKTKKSVKLSSEKPILANDKRDPKWQLMINDTIEIDEI